MKDLKDAWYALKVWYRYLRRANYRWRRDDPVGYWNAHDSYRYND